MNVDINLIMYLKEILCSVDVTIICVISSLKFSKHFLIDIKGMESLFCLENLSSLKYKIISDHFYKYYFKHSF